MGRRVSQSGHGLSAYHHGGRARGDGVRRSGAGGQVPHCGYGESAHEDGRASGADEGVAAPVSRRVAGVVGSDITTDIDDATGYAAAVVWSIEGEEQITPRARSSSVMCAILFNGPRTLYAPPR